MSRRNHRHHHYYNPPPDDFAYRAGYRGTRMPASIAGAIVANIVVGEMVAAGYLVAGSVAAALATAAITYLVGSAVRTAIGSSDAPDMDAALASAGRNITIRQPISSWQVIYGQCRVGGVLTWAHENTTTKGFYLVITLAGHECEEIGTIQFNDEVVPLDVDGVATGKYAGGLPAGQGYAVVEKSLGAGGSQPFPNLVDRAEGFWTSQHRQTGRAKINVRLFANIDLFPTGVPNVSAIVKGKKCYDPRTGLTLWTDNAALCVSDYICDTEFGLGATYATEINETALIAAANICDELVQLSAVGSPTQFEKRYTLNGAFRTNAAPKAIIESMLAAMAGKAVCIGGVWHIYAGAYEAPAITLDEGDLAGPIRVQSLVSRRDNANGVKGVYTSSANFWQPTEFPPVASAVYKAEDNDERVWRDIDLTAFVTSGKQAQRLAKIELFRLRQGLTVTAPFKMTAYRAMAGGTIALTNTKYGWSAKAFEVTGSRFIFDASGSLGVELNLRETAAAVYSWATSDELEEDIAPNTNLPDPFDVTPPSSPIVAEALYETRDGRGVAAVAFLTSTDDDPNVAYVEFQHRLQGATTWIRAAPVLLSSGVADDEIRDITPGIWEFRARAISVLGPKSAFSSTTTQEIFGLSALPSTPTGMSLQRNGGNVAITLDQHPDLDVRRGGRILVRHSESFSGATWETSFSIGQIDGYPGDSVFISVALKPGTYLLRARDSTGQESAGFISMNTKQSSIFDFTPIDDLQEDSGFTGTHSGTVKSGALIQLTQPGSPPGPVTASGTYNFSAALDFLSVTNVRVSSVLEGSVFNINDLFDSDELFDSPDLFDGDADGSLCDAWVECRETDDAPVGSPPAWVGSPSPWTDWKRLDSGEFECRAMEFRLQARSFDPDFNIGLSVLRVRAEAVV